MHILCLGYDGGDHGFGDHVEAPDGGGVFGQSGVIAANREGPGGGAVVIIAGRFLNSA